MCTYWVISWVVIFTSITFIFWYLKVFLSLQKPRAADSVEIFGCVFAVGAVAIWLRPLTGQKWKGFGFGSLWVGAFPLPSAEMSPPVCCRQTRSDEMFETQTAALISVTAGLQLWKNYFRDRLFCCFFHGNEEWLMKCFHCKQCKEESHWTEFSIRECGNELLLPAVAHDGGQQLQKHEFRPFRCLIFCLFLHQFSTSCDVFKISAKSGMLFVSWSKTWQTS